MVSDLRVAVPIPSLSHDLPTRTLRPFRQRLLAKGGRVFREFIQGSGFRGRTQRPLQYPIAAEADDVITVSALGVSSASLQRSRRTNAVCPSRGCFAGGRRIKQERLEWIQWSPASRRSSSCCRR